MLGGLFGLATADFFIVTVARLAEGKPGGLNGSEEEEEMVEGSTGERKEMTSPRLSSALAKSALKKGIENGSEPLTFTKLSCR